MERAKGIILVLLLFLVPLVVGGASYDWVRPDNDYCNDGVCNGSLRVTGNFTVEGDYVNFTYVHLNTTNITADYITSNFIGVGTKKPERPVQIMGQDIGGIIRGLKVDGSDFSQRTILTSFAFNDSRTDILDDTSYGVAISNLDATNNNYAALGMAMNRGRSIAGILALRNVDHTALQSDWVFINRNGDLQEAMTIKYDGKVGMGTTEPVSLLNVEGDNADIYLTQSDGKYSSGLRSNGDGVGQLDLWNNNDDGDSSDAKIHFVADGDNWITGRLGINKTNPLYGSIEIGVDGPAYGLTFYDETGSTARIYRENNELILQRGADVAVSIDADEVTKFHGIINTDNNWISGDGGSEGIQIQDDGDTVASGNIRAPSFVVHGSAYAGNIPAGTAVLIPYILSNAIVRLLPYDSESNYHDMAIGDFSGGIANLYLQAHTGNVGIATANISIAHTLDVGGDIGVATDITHQGDTNTEIKFTSDNIELYVGGETLITAVEEATDYVQIGDASSSVDNKIYDGSMAICNADCSTPAGDGSLLIENDIDASSGTIDTLDGATASFSSYISNTGYYVSKPTDIIIADDAIIANSPNEDVYPVASQYNVDCQDVDGCTITLDEGAGVTDGLQVCFFIESANAVTFTDTAGLTELAGNFVAGQYDSICMYYVSDRFIETTRSNN
jgi:hypothetical protein